MWESQVLKGRYCQEYSIKYIYSTSQMSKLSLTLHTFSITGSVAGLFLTALLSCHPLNLSSSCLLSLQFLSKVIALLYYCSMELDCYSDSISLWHIVPFMPLLNSLTKDLPLYLFPLAALLNF